MKISTISSSMDDIVKSAPLVEFTMVIRVIGGVMIALAISSGARAQGPYVGVPEAPRIQTFDEAGVDLRTGEYQVRSGNLSVGSIDNPAILIAGNFLTRSSETGTPRYSKLERGCDMRYTEQGGYYRCADIVAIYTLGQETLFHQPPPLAPYVEHSLKDGSLVAEDNQNIDVYRPDGTLWRFRKRTDLPSGWPQSNPVEYAVLSVIMKPDGSSLEYNVSSDYNLRGVTSNYGYRWDYEAINPLSNLSTQFCEVGVVKCEGLQIKRRPISININNFPSYTNYIEKRGVNVVRADGVEVNINQSLVGAVSPSMTGSEASSYCGGANAMRTTSVNVGGSVWNYNYTPAWMGGGGNYYCNISETKAVDPNGGVTTVSGIPGSLKITDKLGRVTVYTSEVWSGFAYTNFDKTDGGLVYSAVYPEGNRVDYEYVRRNLSKVTETPKPGGGAARVTFQAGYPADCSVGTMKVCNKPLYTIDANGGRTDYTYHAPSGMVETKTAPAGASGVRPQTRYFYQQLEARILNSAGQLTPTGRPIWKLTSVSECRTQASCANTADETIKAYTYNDNLLPVTETTRVGDNSIAPVTTGTTYEAVGNVVATDGPLPGTADTTYFVYNAYRELVATISPDPDGAGPLPRAVERNIYNADGKPIRVETGTAQATDASDFVLTRFKRMTYDNVTGLLTKVEEVLP